MPSLVRVARLIPIALALSAAVATAATRPSETEPGEIALAGTGPVQMNNPALQRALTKSAMWKNFQSRYGSWTAMWNEATGTPHRAMGQGIPLAGYADDPAAVDNAVRGFIAANASLFGGPVDLATAAVHRAGNIWYVRYHQLIGGVPVLFSDWEFRVAANGRLVAFGADARHPTTDVAASARIVGAVARRAAAAGLSFDPSTDRAEGEDLYVLPTTRDGHTDYRTVYAVRVRTSQPHESWLSLVDAGSGEVVWRQSLIHFAVTGQVTAGIHPSLPTDPLSIRNLRNLFVNVGAIQAVTDNNGLYSASPSGNVNVSAGMSGRFCQVFRQDLQTNASYTKSNVSPSSVVNIAWVSGNSNDAERDCYYHVNVAHDYVKGVDPAYTGNDIPIICNVLYNDDECSDTWDFDPVTGQGALGFWAAGPTCPNIASVPTMVYHDYGHSVNDLLYVQHGSVNGMMSKPLQEGLADAFAAYVSGSSVVGAGYYGPGTIVRDLSADLIWPQDGSPDSHGTGAILAGALWDLRQALGPAVADHLMQFARYGLPDDAADPGVAFSEYFVDVLVADDDDANLANGTPHFNQIAAVFNAHGIGTNYFINIAHNAIDDQPTSGPYPVNATIQYNGPVGALDINSPTLYYSVNNLPYEAQSMFPTGNPDEWAGEIPPQAAGIVRYYIRVTDTNGGVRTQPAGAPSFHVNTFVAGPATALVSQDMETDPGWVIGATGDNATTGIWVRADPIGTAAQPENDHTPGAGTMCYVTGNSCTDPGSFPGCDDVDDGHTTLTSSTFNAAAPGMLRPIVSYWRWYSNNVGTAPGTDFWKAYISNNGGSSWVPIENTTQSDLSWRRVVFYVKDYVTPTNNMKLRFVAEDAGDPSLVEAAVDDFALLAFPTPTGVGDPAPGRALSLARPAPNPFASRTLFRYSLPAAGRAALTVFDINGRAIRKLLSGAEAAGTHSIEWDGRDDQGHAMAAGPYFLRLEHEGHTLSQAVVRIK